MLIAVYQTLTSVLNFSKVGINSRAKLFKRLEIWQKLNFGKVWDVKNFVTNAGYRSKAEVGLKNW